MIHLSIDKPHKYMRKNVKKKREKPGEYPEKNEGILAISLNKLKSKIFLSFG